MIACDEVGGDVDDGGAAAIFVVLELGLDFRRRGAPDGDVRDGRIPLHGERRRNSDTKVFLVGDGCRDGVIGNRDGRGKGRGVADGKALARGRGDRQVGDEDRLIVPIDLGLCGAVGDELEVVGG